MSDTSSLPDLPAEAETSRGSSVSTSFVNEYDELLKYAIVAPRFNVQPSVYNDNPSIPLPKKDEELLISLNESTETEVTDEHQVAGKTLEDKWTVRRSSEHKNAAVQFKIPNALDALIDYSSATPAKKTEVIDEQLLSVNSTPESGVCSPSSCIDKDLLRMDSQMDDWCLQLKRNILAELAEMKAKQLQNEEIAVNEAKIKYKMDMQRLVNEVDGLKELLYTFEQNVKQKDEMISNLTEALNKQKEKSDKIRMFSMWRLKLNDEHRLEFASKMADKFYKKNLLMKVWDGWRNVVENKWKIRVEKACQIKSQEICLKVTEDYEERLQALQRELSTSRADVAQLHTERDCYEENMKKAFMRGVCALNMEAMSMFKEGGGDENCPPQYPHHPCTVPSSTVAASGQRYDQMMANDNCAQNADESGNLSKHVTFGMQRQHEEPSSCNKSNIAKNKKNLHVKMVGKKENRKEKTFGSRPSTISSIKVERHIPHETSQQQQRPSSSLGAALKSNFKNDDAATDGHPAKRSHPKTTKVVD